MCTLILQGCTQPHYRHCDNTVAVIFVIANFTIIRSFFVLAYAKRWFLLLHTCIHKYE